MKCLLSFCPTLCRFLSRYSAKDFYVTVEDLRSYAAALIDFWTELADTLEADGIDERLSLPGLKKL